MKVWICVDPNDDEMTLRGSEENCAFYDSDARPGGHGPSCNWARLVSVDALVIEKVDGKWPKKARQKVASALGEAVGHERRNTLTVDTFVGIGDFLLDNLASETDLNVARLKDALASNKNQVGESE